MKAKIGEIRKYGNHEYVKVANGWKYLSKKPSLTAQKHIETAQHQSHESAQSIAQKSIDKLDDMFAKKSFNAHLTKDSKPLFHATSVDVILSILEDESLKTVSAVMGKEKYDKYIKGGIGMNRSYGRFVYCSIHNPLKNGFFYGATDPHCCIQLKPSIFDKCDIYSSPFEDNVHLIHKQSIPITNIQSIYVDREKVTTSQLRQIKNHCSDFDIKVHLT